MNASSTRTTGPINGGPGASSAVNPSESRDAARLITRGARRVRSGTAVAVGVLAMAVAAPALTPAHAATVAATTAAHPVLKRGMTAGAVAVVQKALGVRTTSYFGSETLAAVKKYQAAKGLPTTGIVGPQTWAALVADKKAPALLAARLWPKGTSPASPSPSASATPKPTVSPKPTATPKPTVSPKPTATPKPSASPKPSATPKPTVSPKPSASPTPSATPTPNPSATASRGPNNVEVDLAKLPKLRQGMTSAYVATVQDALSVAPTGYFGTLTLAAVKQYQADAGMAVTGVVGKPTWASLIKRGGLRFPDGVGTPPAPGDTVPTTLDMNLPVGWKSYQIWGGNAKLHPDTLRMGQYAMAKFGSMFYGIGGWRADGGVSPDHPNGEALDMMVKDWKSATGKANGDAVAWFFQKYHREFGIYYIIWRQRIWNASFEKPGSHPSTWRMMSDRGNPTDNHMDHVHISTWGHKNPKLNAPADLWAQVDRAIEAKRKRIAARKAKAAAKAAAAVAAKSATN